MRPSIIPKGIVPVRTPVSKMAQQAWQKCGSCPEGTIPIRRIKKNDLARAMSVTNVIPEANDGSLGQQVSCSIQTRSSWNKGQTTGSQPFKCRSQKHCKLVCAMRGFWPCKLLFPLEGEILHFNLSHVKLKSSWNSLHYFSFSVRKNAKLGKF